MTGIHDNVTAVRQGFRSDIKGEAIVLCRTASIARLMSVVDRTFGDGVYGGMATPDEVVFDVANVLMGACVASILDVSAASPCSFRRGCSARTCRSTTYSSRPSWHGAWHCCWK